MWATYQPGDIEIKFFFQKLNQLSLDHLFNNNILKVTKKHLITINFLFVQQLTIYNTLVLKDIYNTTSLKLRNSD